MLSYYTVVDVSAQDKCAITPVKHTTLIAGSEYEMKNMTIVIQCNCVDDDGRALSSIRWFNPAGTRIFTQGHRKHVSGTPHYKRFNGSATLIIPTFNDSYYGTYICGIGNKFSSRKPNVHVNLTLDGKHSYVGTLYIVT